MIFSDVSSVHIDRSVEIGAGAVIGANNFGNVFSQLLIYYQAVPILLDYDEENLQCAKNCGVYYTLGKDDNWQKEVSSITGGRMAKSVVYVSDSDIPPKTAFMLAGYNAHVAFTGLSGKNTSFSYASAVKKQLILHFINIGYGYISSSINLIANRKVASAASSSTATATVALQGDKTTIKVTGVVAGTATVTAKDPNGLNEAKFTVTVTAE